MIEGIYRHQHSNINDFQDSFTKTIELLNKTNSVYYILGDLNIDLFQSDKKISTKNILIAHIVQGVFL